MSAMTDNLRIITHMARKLESDHNFIAYAMKKYGEVEKISEGEICSLLSCSLEDYYKLALCRVPDVNADDFVARLNKISQYGNASIAELNRIIKRVTSIERLGTGALEQRTYLMAARDKHKK